MKRNWPYILVLLLVVVFLVRVSKKDTQRTIRWDEDYTGSSKSPFGCYVVKDFLDEIVPAGVEDVDKTAYVQLTEQEYSNHNYVFINSEFQFSAQDVIQLCKFAEKGNTVFISARDFGQFLEDTLKFRLDDPLMLKINQDSVTTLGGAVSSGSQNTEANLVNPSLHLSHNAVFDRTSYTTVFVRVDTAKTTVLGVDAGNFVNYIKVKFGKGQFLLHSLPDAFGNYYAADKRTSKYLFRALSYLPDQTTFFDEHYKVGYVQNRDSRRYVLSEPALKLAYLIVIIIGLIALFFGGKRRQRAVKVVAPPTNATLEFVEQIGVLYYRQGNHSDIVRKKINYFLESVRSRFFTQTNVFDEKFLERLHNLSGVPRDQVQHLFATIDYLRTTQGAGEKDLKNLEQLIWDFNQRSKR
jgi:hypothetical protein